MEMTWPWAVLLIFLGAFTLIGFLMSWEDIYKFVATRSQQKRLDRLDKIKRAHELEMERVRVRVEDQAAKLEREQAPSAAKAYALRAYNEGIVPLGSDLEEVKRFERS